MGVEPTARDEVGHFCNQKPIEDFAIPDDTTEIIFVRHGESLNNVFMENLIGNSRKVISQSARALLGSTKAKWELESKSRFERGYGEVCLVRGLCGPQDPTAGDHAEEEAGLAEVEARKMRQLMWEMKHRSQDCLLHPDGEDDARSLQSVLSQVLPEGLPIEGFFVSPLRRTLQTLLSAWGSFLKGVPVKVQPWLHEKYKTKSDLAHDGGFSAAFLGRYLEYLQQPQLAGVVHELQNQLVALGDDWTSAYGDLYPESLEVPVRRKTDAAWDELAVMEFYPFSAGLPRESSRGFQQRMEVLRRWMKKLRPGARYVMVAHSGIAKALFEATVPEGLRLDNLGTIVARFKPSEAEPSDARRFFAEVRLAAETWDCEQLPGWAALAPKFASDVLVDFTAALGTRNWLIAGKEKYSCCCTTSTGGKGVACQLVLGEKKCKKGYFAWTHGFEASLDGAGECRVPLRLLPRELLGCGEGEEGPVAFDETRGLVVCSDDVQEKQLVDFTGAMRGPRLELEGSLPSYRCCCAGGEATKGIPKCRLVDTRRKQGQTCESLAGQSYKPWTGASRCLVPERELEPRALRFMVRDPKIGLWHFVAAKHRELTSSGEYVVDFSSIFEGSTLAAEEMAPGPRSFSVSYRCCCLKDGDCKLVDESSAKVSRFAGPCGKLMGRGYLTWNSVRRKAPWKCAVPLHEVPGIILACGGVCPVRGLAYYDTDTELVRCPCPG